MAANISNDRFLRACRGEHVDRVPVWFMRQAGRSLPEYRALRARHSILEICHAPEVAAEATLQPVRRLGVDAAILFSDIVVPLEHMGVELSIEAGKGPVIAHPVRAAADVDRLQPIDAEEGIPAVNDAIRIAITELDVPLIAFGGAPFTLASYLVEGGPSKDHALTKGLLYSEPETWHKLMDRLAEAVLAHLRAQVRAGAAAIQLFDSWVGAVSPDDYRAHVQPSTQRILEGLADLGVPRIHFGVGTAELLEPMAEAGADVMGIDWRTPLRTARARLGQAVALQGNMDPVVCLGPWEIVEERARDVLEQGGGRGHVFNLGHGVHPGTRPETLERLVTFVHSWEPPA